MTPPPVERPMKLNALAALLVLGILALPAPAAAQSPSHALVINVHTATPQGCGDYGFGPHYSYRVYVDGAQVASSPTWNPVNGVVAFYDLAQVDVGAKTTLTVGFEVVDHAATLFGSSEHPCNLTASGPRASVTYTLGSPQLVRTGSANDGAAIEAYVSDTTLPAPLAPTVQIAGAPTASSANVTWSALSIPGFAHADLLDPDDSMALLSSTASASPGSFAWTGLEENTAHQAQLRAYGGSWIVASNAARFTTANLPPPTPQVAFEAVNDTHATLVYDNPPHDIDRLDVYLSTDASFQPGSASLKAGAAGPFPRFVDLDGLSPATTYYAIARATDTAGASTDSPRVPFATSGPGVQPTPSAPAAAPTPSPTPATPGVPPSSPDPTPASTTPPPPSPTPVPATLETQIRTYQDVTAAFEVKTTPAFDGAHPTVNVTPGSTLTIQVLLVNRGDVPLHVEVAGAGAAYHNDTDIGRFVVAEGFNASLSLARVDIPGPGKVAATFSVRVPLTASVGDRLMAWQMLNVSDGAITVPASVGAGLAIVPPVVGASVEADASAGLSTSTILVVGGVGAAGALAVGVALLRRDAARYALAVALYTRLARSQVLDHPAREALGQRIASEPGVCYTDLQRASGLNTGALVHHLHALERAGVVTSRKEGAYRRFYPAGAAPRADVARVEPLTPMQARALEIVRQESPTQGELAQRLGLTQQGASHHVKALERAGHVEVVHDGKVWRYRAVARFEVLR